MVRVLGWVLGWEKEEVGQAERRLVGEEWGHFWGLAELWVEVEGDCPWRATRKR